MRLIDANKLKQDVLDWENCYNGFSDTYDKAMIIGEIDAQPTIDAEPIIRCKDCHYAKPFNKIWQLPKSDTLVCTYFTEEVDNNFFCGCAIKKIDEVNDGT